MNYNINDMVKLKTFFGTMIPENDIDDTENYWKLIGQYGKIIAIKSKIGDVS